MPGTRPWAEERIEAHHVPERTVTVFRWVPDLDVETFRHHPTFAEWLARMADAAEGLTDAAPAHREHYDSIRYGVTGRRAMTDAERLSHARDLERQISTAQAAVFTLTGATPMRP